MKKKDDMRRWVTSAVNKKETRPEKARTSSFLYVSSTKFDMRTPIL